MRPRERSRTFYRVALVLPAGMLVYLVASGRFAAYWRLFSSFPSPPAQRDFDASFATALLWLAAVSPLVYAAWEIGREHVAARRLGFELLVGFREVVRRAMGQELSATELSRRSAEYARAPRDDPRSALAWGAVTAVGIPAFVAAFAPFLRSPRATIWLGVAGAIMGSIVYCRRRAMAYLRDEPGRWDPFREYRLLNTSRYEAPAHAFVRWQLFGSVLLVVWWLGGGAWLLSGQ